MAAPQVLALPLDELHVNVQQARQHFDRAELEAMAASILARGILQPIRVRKTDRGYEVIFGECRLRAARIAGLTEVPCLVVEGEPDEISLLEDQIVENAVRHALRPLDFARALARLKVLKGGCTSQALAKELGLSGSAISRALALLGLPEDIQLQVDSGVIPESTAYEISRLPDADGQRELAGLVVANRWKRERVTDAVHGAVGKREAKPKSSRLSVRLDGGLAITVSGGEPLTWETLLAAFGRLQRAGQRLKEGGKPPSELPGLLRPRERAGGPRPPGADPHAANGGLTAT